MDLVVLCLYTPADREAYKLRLPVYFPLPTKSPSQEPSLDLLADMDEWDDEEVIAEYVMYRRPAETDQDKS